MALFITLFGLDLGRSVGLGLIGGLTALTIYNYSRRSFILYCLLLLFWPVFAWSHTAFGGEIFTIMMVMVGLSLWEKSSNCHPALCGHQPPSSNKTWGNPLLWMAGLAFGAAIATKLVAGAFVPLLLFCQFFHTLHSLPVKTDKTGYVYWLVIPLLIALLFFIIQFSISIIHSGGHIDTIFPTLKLFVASHLRIAETTKETFDKIYFRESDIPIMAIMALSLYLLIKNNTIFLLHTIILVVLLFYFHLNLRRLLPLTVPLMLMSIKTEDLSHSKTSLHGHYTNLILFSYGIILMAAYFSFNTPIYLIDTLRHFSLTGAPHNMTHITKTQNANQNTYDARLISIIKNLEGPVFTSGWWQFPEISLRTGTTFHNRFAIEESQLLHSAKQCFLLFTPKKAEDASTENMLCGKIVFQDGDLVLCEYSPDGR